MMKIFYRRSWIRCTFALLTLSAGCSTRAQPTGDPLCDTATSISLNQAYDRYFSATPSSGVGGCAQLGCHGDGAGGLRFTNITEFYAAVVNARSTTSGRVYVTPREPGNSYLYQRMASADQGERMPLGGPYLNDAQLAEVAGWICAGAPRPGEGANDAGTALAPTDGGSL